MPIYRATPNTYLSHFWMLISLLSLGVLTSSCSVPSQPPVPQPPNILFIAVDDLNTDIGCYGHSQVQTPNLDKLAKSGVRFEHAYCQQALCGPSRASIMTGMRPNTTGFVHLKDNLRKLRPDVETLGQYFQKQGYYVGRVGKIYHYGNPSEIGTDGHDDTLSWQVRFNPIGIDKVHEDSIIRFPGGKTGIKGNLGISMAYWDPVSEDNEHTDGMVAEQAIRMIEQQREEPFFIAAGFFNPHCPYVAPKKYFDLYPIENITIPSLEEAKKDLKDVPPMAVQRDTPNWPYYFEGITIEEARKCKQAYYASVSFIDAQIGKLIEALESNGLLANTLIVFWSDHGYFLGEKGLWYKRKSFERSVKVPLIIAGFGVEKGGTTVYEPVELLDLYPTLVDAVGKPVPKTLEGRSLVPFLQGEVTDWDKPAISQTYHAADAQGYSIRTNQWRYTEWMGGEAGRELYDHTKDSEEINNLAQHPDYQVIVRELSEELSIYQKFEKDGN